MTKLQRNWAICTGCIVLMIVGLIGSYQSSTQAQNIAGTPITRQPNQPAVRSKQRHIIGDFGNGAGTANHSYRCKN